MLPQIYKHFYVQEENLCFFFFFLFLGLHVWHMEAPGLGIESELQLPAYTTATTMQECLQPTPWPTATPDHEPTE